VVTGTDTRPVWLPGTRACLVPPALARSFAPALLDLVSASAATLVVPTVTEELPVVARMRAALERRGCAVFISSPRTVDIADDKLETARFLSAHGVAVPRSLPGEVDRARIVDELGLPVLAKPRHGRGGRGIALHRTLGEAERDRRPGIVFQEFIPGEEFDVNLFVAGDGRATAAVLRKTRLRDGIVGNADGVERSERGDVLQVAVDAVRQLGLRGPLDIDVRLRRDGDPALLEVNARLGANVLAAPEVLDAMIGSWGELSWS
jgi:carbamoyl-phosphate synthase large subunit